MVNANEFISRHKISKKRLRNIIQSFQNIKICIIGDVIVDEYISCDPLGMSQEDPTLVVTPIDNQTFLGGAGIVAAHASGLGANVKIISVVGDDNNYHFIKNKLKEYNVSYYLFPDESRPTTLKKRYRANNKTLLRVNHLKQFSINEELQNSIIKKFLRYFSAHSNRLSFI